MKIQNNKRSNKQKDWYSGNVDKISREHGQIVMNIRTQIKLGGICNTFQNWANTINTINFFPKC